MSFSSSLDGSGSRNEFCCKRLGGRGKHEFFCEQVVDPGAAQGGRLQACSAVYKVFVCAQLPVFSWFVGEMVVQQRGSREPEFKLCGKSGFGKAGKGKKVGG